MNYRALAAALLVIAGPLWGKQTFQEYEGADAVQQGQGGTKVSKNGVDYWTTGTPPRYFQIIGILTDARKDRLFDGDVIGSKSVADKVLAAGGNAVIVAGSSTKAAGIIGGLSQSANSLGNNSNSYASFHGRQINRTTTQLVVIKYIP